MVPRETVSLNCFPESPDVSRDEVEGNIRTRCFLIYLRRNPPHVGVTSGQKPCTKIIYIVLQNNSFLATPNVENEC